MSVGGFYTDFSTPRRCSAVLPRWKADFAVRAAGNLAAPAPAEFLWQYINLTPMGPFVAQAPEAAKAAMERQVVETWQPYVVDGATPVEQPMVIATGRR